MDFKPPGTKSANPPILIKGISSVGLFNKEDK